MKREIKKKPKPPKMDLDMINLLTQICFRYDKIEKSDLIFVFGTNILHKKIAKHIEYMLINNLSNRVLITGGIANYLETEYKDIPESRLIFNNIDINKFNEVQFILEEFSKNNIENVLNAEKLIDFKKLDSIICISHSYASNRSVQTLRNIFKKKILSYPFDILGKNLTLIDKGSWFQNEEGKSIVWGEYLRIKTYGERRDFPLTNKMKILLDKINSKTNNL